MSFSIDGLRRGRFSTFLLSSFLVLGTAACGSDADDAPAGGEIDAGNDAGPGKDDSGSPENDAGERDGDTDPTLARIEITPAQASVKERRAVQFEAKAFDENDAELPAIAFTWASANEAIATIDEAGLLTSLKPGQVTIGASAGGKSAKATITVTEATIESLELSLDATEIPVDGKVTIRVVVKDDEGFELLGRDITLESQNEAVARIEGKDKVLGFGPGKTKISAKLDTFEDSVEVRVVHRFTKLFGGYIHACGLTVAGRAWCWGANGDGQLGHGDESRHVGPVRVAADAAIVFESVALGINSTCGLTDERKLWCFGDNYDLQLGIEERDTYPTPFLVADRSYRALSALSYAFCGLDDSGFAHCWGENRSEDLFGNPDVNESSATPVAVAAPEGEAAPVAFTEIQSGWYLSCGLTSLGRLYCWGDNALGDLGDGTTVRRARAVGILPGKRVRTFAIGVGSTCAVTEDETTYCWGFNPAGLVPGGSSTVRVPTKVFDKARFVPASLVLGYEHACALDSEGRAFCWGGNARGQLGRDLAFKEAPLGEVEGGHRFSSLIAGEYFTCGLASDGKTYCWGDNQYGQLGNDTLGKSMVPTLVSGQ